MLVLQNSGESCGADMIRWKFGVAFSSAAGVCSISPFSSSRVVFDVGKGLLIENDGNDNSEGVHEGRWYDDVADLYLDTIV